MLARKSGRHYGFKTRGAIAGQSTPLPLPLVVAAVRGGYGGRDDGSSMPPQKETAILASTNKPGERVTRCYSKQQDASAAVAGAATTADTPNRVGST